MRLRRTPELAAGSTGAQDMVPLCTWTVHWTAASASAVGSGVGVGATGELSVHAAASNGSSRAKPRRGRWTSECFMSRLGGRLAIRQEGSPSERVRQF
jgi:hypothetical protein